MLSRQDTPKTRLRFNKRITLLSLVVLIAGVTPAQVIHEAGHAAVCSYEGYQYEISMDAFGAYTICQGEVGENLLFRAFGGVFASLVFFGILIIPKFRSTPWLFIPMLSLSLGHLANAFVETFAYESYIAGDVIWSGVLMMVSYAVFIGLLIKYGRTPQPC